MPRNGELARLNVVEDEVRNLRRKSHDLSNSMTVAIGELAHIREQGQEFKDLLLRVTDKVESLGVSVAQKVGEASAVATTASVRIEDHVKEHPSSGTSRMSSPKFIGIILAAVTALNLGGTWAFQGCGGRTFQFQHIPAAAAPK